MTQKFEVRTNAERFIHNDLSNCAWGFRREMQRKFESGDTTGVYFDMMGALVFFAFSIEAKINFVGWKTLENGWPEKASLREKIDLLNKLFKTELDWGERPLQTINKLRKLRDTLAHGKPEIIKDRTEVTDVEPEVWDALKGQWEAAVNPDFVERCYEDIDGLWQQLLAAAEIDVHHTLTTGGHRLRVIVEPEAAI